MPMIAKTGTIAKPRGKKMYRSAIGPEKDPEKQATDIASFIGGMDAVTDPQSKVTAEGRKNPHFREGKIAGREEVKKAKKWPGYGSAPTTRQKSLRERMTDQYLRAEIANFAPKKPTKK